MATTNHVVVPNVIPSNIHGGAFNQYWALTRALKKAGWKYLASAFGVSTDLSADPELDLWGAGMVSNVGAAAASISAPSRGRAVVAGLTGIVAADKGKFLCLSGSGTPANNHYHQIEEVLGGTSVKIDARTFAVAADAGPLTWEIRDPTLDLFVNELDDTSYAWIVMRGPSTLKIPIAAAPSLGPTGSTFVRGENVVQATTGAEGEIIGFVFDGVSTGYLTIAPRLRGTGSGVYGWDTANAVVGNISGASATQSGVALEYRHEIVFGSAGDGGLAGIIWVGCFEPVGEATDMFSDATRLAATSRTLVVVGTSDNGWPVGISIETATPHGLTNGRSVLISGVTGTVEANGSWVVTYVDATHFVLNGSVYVNPWISGGSVEFPTCPGGNENFPTYAWAVLGDSIPTFRRWVGSDGSYSGSVTCGNAQVMCADAIEEQLHSADGSWTIAIAAGLMPSSATPRQGDHVGHSFQRCDDCEAGDLDPYVTVGPGDGTVDRVAASVSDSSILNSVFSYEGSFAGGARYIRGWRGRGMASDSAANFCTFTANNMFTWPSDYLYPEMEFTALVPTIIKDPIWVINNASIVGKMRKGSMRWLANVVGGASGSTRDSKRWLQISTFAPAFIAGPWDGVTSPAF